MKDKISILLIATGLLSTISCTQNWDLPESENESDEITMTFSIQEETDMTSSRALSTKYISTGERVDRVVYAVYATEYTGTGVDFRLLEHYGDTDYSGKGLGKGQSLLPSTANLLKEGGETLTLRLMRGQEYAIAFWAQNSECKVYNTSSLRSVVVDYTNGNGGIAPNNDESRDAFCQVHTFTAQPQAEGVVEEVILKRALAQINVGTAGWDYNEEVDYGNNFAYSKIEMTGLYDQLDVLTGEVSKTEAVKDGDNDKTITYTWAKLPAYIKTDYPTNLPDTDFASWLKEKDKNDEFLYVRLVTDNGSDYIDNWGEVPETEDEIGTETFKYLSMCYVLAPMYDPEDKNIPARAGTTISNVKFYLSETSDGKFYTDEERTQLSDVSERFSIGNVPIQRNWRTNILGGTRGKSTTLFDPRTVSLLVDLSPGYDGEHNYTGNEENNEYPPKTQNN